MKVVVIEKEAFEDLKRRHEELLALSEEIVSDLRANRKIYYNANEAADYLSLTPEIIESHAEEIGYYQVGVKLFKKQDLHSWVDANYYKKK